MYGARGVKNIVAEVDESNTRNPKKKSKENKLCPYLLDGVRVTVVDCSK